MNVSVAMCTYNGSRFLAAQLHSIAQQLRLPDELVVCDDCSTDTTVAIVESFARTVSFPVRVYRNEQNLRSTKNFEKAMLLCTGDAIVLCDQDDVWLPEKLATLAAVLEADPAVAGVFSNAALIDEAGATLPGDLWSSVHYGPKEARAFRDDQALFLLHRPLVTGATFMFRAQFLDQVTPIPAEWVHDGWIALILAAAAKLEALPQLLIHYRLHSSQQLGVREVPKHVAAQRGREERLNFYRPEAIRWAQMVEKLTSLRASMVHIRFVQKKAAYMRARVRLLQQTRAARVLSGLWILRGHFQFGWGPVSYLRDLLHD